MLQTQTNSGTYVIHRDTTPKTKGMDASAGSRTSRRSR
jgi:hypothetical protein